MKKVYCVSFGWNSKVAFEKVEDATKFYEQMTKSTVCETTYASSLGGYLLYPSNEKVTLETNTMYSTKEEIEALEKVNQEKIEKEKETA